MSGFLAIQVVIFLFTFLLGFLSAGLAQSGIFGRHGQVFYAYFTLSVTHASQVRDIENYLSLSGLPVRLLDGSGAAAIAALASSALTSAAAYLARDYAFA